MKICLINPPHPYLKQPTAQAPLGLMYVAAACRDYGYEVTFIDLSDRHYQDEFALPPADIYGLTGTVLDRTPCVTVATRIHNTFKDAKVIIGGPISLTPDLLDNTIFDAIVQGEGEHIIKTVIEDYPKLLPVYKGERIEDLDSIAFPARDMVNNLGGNVFAFNKNYVGDKSTVLITSRGCPYNCAFCASPGIWKRKVYFRSVENVLAEVEEIVQKYNIRQLRFSDDTLTLKEKRLVELCIGLKRLNVVWRASIRVKPNAVDMFKHMYECGCREVSFGVESGDPDVLAMLRKGNTVEDNRAGIVNANAAGLVVRILFMIGTPGETEATAQRNIAFLEGLRDHYATVALTNFIPLPGSAIAEHPEWFDCAVLSRNIDDFNFYMWGPEGLNEWKNFIRLNGLSNKLFSENKQKMRNYIINSGKSNQG